MTRREVNPDRWLWPAGAGVVTGIVLVVVLAQAGSTGWAITFGFATLVPAIALGTASTHRVDVAHLERLRAHVAEVRPTATLIPVMTGSEMYSVAKARRSTPRGWRVARGGTAVLAVLDDCIEVWTGRHEPAPRWSVVRRNVRIRVAEIRVGGFYRTGVQVLDDVPQIVAVPRYGSVSAFDTERQAVFVDRALRQLGEEPDIVRSDVPEQENRPQYSTAGRSTPSRRLIAGPSARTVERLTDLVVWGTCILYATFFVLAAILRQDDAALLALLVGTVAAFALIVLRFYVPFRREREWAAGYTTSMRGWFASTVDVDVVDRRSRRVIRRAGEPRMSPDHATQRDHVRARTREARSADRLESV